jgi:hypothetical protein
VLPVRLVGTIAALAVPPAGAGAASFTVPASAQLEGLTVTLRSTVDTETNSGAALCAGGGRPEAGESC